MNARWDSGPLLQPIPGERPCGDNLDDTELLSSFDTYRLFGQAKPLDAPAEPGEGDADREADSEAGLVAGMGGDSG